MRYSSSFFLPVTWLLITCSLLAGRQTSPPSTDIWLVDLQRDHSLLTLGKPVNLTDRPGYDNQPSFTPDGNRLLFTSQREAGQTDIYAFELATQQVTQLCKTPESEYSPTITPDQHAYSVIRVEADQAQRLWQFPLAGGAPTLVLPNLKPVGYHVWLDAHTLALFVLGQPNTLQLADTRTGKTEILAQSIGRALHRIPGQPRQFSFVHKAETEWWVKVFDLKSRQIIPLIKTLPKSEDCAWLPDGTLLMAQGSQLFKWQRGKDRDWQLVADLSAAGMSGITRLAVNPRGDRLALVAQVPNQ